MTVRKTSLWRAYGWSLAAGLVVLLGVAVRCAFWDQVFDGDMIVLMDTDPYYHVWRARMLAREFPAVASFDPFISFPAGAHIPWPPGFGWLIALPAILGAGEGSIEIWGTLLMPLLGGLATWLTFLFGRFVFGRAVGLLAALLLAISPVAANYSMLGRIDHHALVAPVVLGMYLAFLRAIEPSNKGGWAWGLLAAALAGVSVAGWIITPPLYFAPLPLMLLVLRVGGRPEPQQKKVAALFLLSAVLLVALMVLAFGSRDLPFTLYQPSWFTVLLFLAAATAALPYVLGWKPAFTCWLALLAGGTALFVFSPAIAEPLLAAWRVLAGQDATYLMASESSSAVLFEGMLDLFAPSGGYSYLFNLVPFFIVAYFFTWWKKYRQEAKRSLLLVAFPYSFVLVVMQSRFCEYGGPFVFLLMAWVLVEGFRHLLELYRAGRLLWRQKALTAVLVLAVIFALSPMVLALKSTIFNTSFRVPRIAQKTARELAAHITPDRSGSSFGLLAPWNLSHLFLLHTSIPVMVSSFGTRDAFVMNREGFSILLEENEETAYSKMKANRLRFMVATPLLEDANLMAKIAGKERSFGEIIYEPKHVLGGWNWSFKPTFLLSRIIVTRMLLCDGSACRIEDTEHLPLEHLRLFVESKEGVNLFRTNFSFIKVFEAVEGAVLKGHAAPNQKVRLRLSLESNTGRRFLYHRSTFAGENGEFSFTVPYPNEPYAAPTKVLGPYRIKIGERVIHVQVSESEVQEGKVVWLEPPGQGSN